jgi:hypothetical protein
MHFLKFKDSSRVAGRLNWVYPDHSSKRPETERAIMPDLALISVQALRKAFHQLHPQLRRIAIVLLICCTLAHGVLADSVTYQQLQQNQGGRAAATSPTAALAADQNQPQNNQGQNPQSQSSQSPQSSQSQGGVAQESPNHPEFVRLPDGRIVRYGPGILCDENCVEPVTPAAFREPGPRMWWIVPPIVAGAVLCAFLCRGGDSEPQPTPTIIIPPVQPTVTPTTQPTASPTMQPTPPPDEIPEPGTLVLLGLGIGTMLARRRMRGKKEQG